MKRKSQLIGSHEIRIIYEVYIQAEKNRIKVSNIALIGRDWDDKAIKIEEM